MTILDIVIFLQYNDIYLQITFFKKPQKASYGQIVAAAKCRTARYRNINKTYNYSVSIYMYL